MNKFNVMFAKATTAADGVTVGKNYAVVRLPESDTILTDALPLKPVPTNCAVLGSVTLVTSHELTDAGFTALLNRCLDDFCDNMHIYYCRG